MANPQGGEPAFEDLTARARIRDAALRLFVEKGIDGVSIRDIAKEAGVSSGLIRHHFGSKEGLRDACDTYAMDRLMRFTGEVVFEDRLKDPDFLVTVEPVKLRLHRYLARSMVDGSQSATAMFDRLVDLAEQWLANDPSTDAMDVRAYAAVLVGSQIGLLMMYDHVHRALGSDVDSLEGNIRVSMGAVDLHSNVLFTPELAAQARAAYERLRPPGSSNAAGSTGGQADEARDRAKGAER